MYKQIGNLLKDNKGKKLDKGFILDACDIMISHDQLDKFVSNITFEDEDAFGTYDYKTGIININLEKVLETQSFNKQLEVLQTIRHEIEHVRNFKKYSEGRRDIESVVLGFSYKTATHSESRLNPQPVLFNAATHLSEYTVDPDERIAEIKAFRFMVNLLKNRRNSLELLISRQKLYESYIRGYVDNGFWLDPPTYTYLLKVGLYEEYKIVSTLLSDSNNYSLETRALCGLPITKEEKELELVLKCGLKNTNNS